MEPSDTTPANSIFQIAVAFRGDRGLEHELNFYAHSTTWIAVAFRGDRGLELLGFAGRDTTIRLRSPFGAIEDWNNVTLKSSLNFTNIAVAFRGDRGLELGSLRISDNKSRLRSPFGAIKDWNVDTRFYDRAIEIAVAFRGDRGLELPVDRWLVGAGIAVAFRGDRGLELFDRCHDLMSQCVLRSPFGAIEDWNNKFIPNGFTTS